MRLLGSRIAFYLSPHRFCLKPIIFDLSNTDQSHLKYLHHFLYVEVVLVKIALLALINFAFFTFFVENKTENVIFVFISLAPQRIGNISMLLFKLLLSDIIV